MVNVYFSEMFKTLCTLDVLKQRSVFHKDLNIDILFILRLVEDVGEPALPAVLTVEHGGHEDAGAALFSRALAPQTVDLAVVVDLVVLQHGELDLPLLVLDLLGGGVVLLLPLLGSPLSLRTRWRVDSFWML